MSWSFDQPAPFFLLERLAVGDLFGEMTGEAWGSVGVSFPMDIVLSAESGVVGLGEEDEVGFGEADIMGPLVLAFFAGWSLEGGESLFLSWRVISNLKYIFHLENLLSFAGGGASCC